MRLIKEICEYIHEEIHDAEKYVSAALEYKDEFPDTAETFYVLSMEELNHMQILHNAVAALITPSRTLSFAFCSRIAVSVAEIFASVSR